MHTGGLDEAARQLRLAAADLGSTAQDDALLRSGLGLLAIVTGDLAAARQHLGAGLRLATQMPDLLLAARVGVGVSQLALRRGDARGAAQILGAAHALRGVPDTFNRDVVRLNGELRDRLDKHTYLAAYEHGHRLSQEDALAVIQAHLRS